MDSLEDLKWTQMFQIKDRFAFLFNNKHLSDVQLIIGHHRISAHKLVVSAGSPVFHAMINGAMANPEADELEFPADEPDAFLVLLKFLYSDKVELEEKSAMSILQIANKYGVSGLESKCIEFLKLNLSIENVFSILEHAQLFHKPELATLCYKIIDMNASKALSTEGFLDVNLDTLCATLERATLRVQEAELFLAVQKWSEKECARKKVPINPENQRAMLDRSILLIRFPLMTVDEFTMGASGSGILTQEEVASLQRYFTEDPKPSVCFPTTPRSCVQKSICRFRECLQKIEHRVQQNPPRQSMDRIKFSVNRPIIVVGIRLYQMGNKEPTDYSIQVQVKNATNGRPLPSKGISIEGDRSTPTFLVKFAEPIEIFANVQYAIHVLYIVTDEIMMHSYIGTQGRRKASADCPVCGKVVFSFETDGAGFDCQTCRETGQIPEIVFFTKENPAQE